MAKRVAVQMDHISNVQIVGDTTFALCLEAQARGHTLLHYTPDQLSMRDGVVFATMQPLEVRDTEGDHYTLGAPERVDLTDVDVVLLRQDPPFDMHYTTTTHLLERVHPQTLVVNDPHFVRNLPEKIFVTEFPELMPPTLVTTDMAEIKAFRAEMGDIIVKPLFGNGGAGVFFLRKDDQNLSSLLEMFAGLSREQLMVQQYLPDVRAGDKRVILIDGEPVGAINRIPAEGDARSNMHVGGMAVADQLTERDRQICAAIGPRLKEMGQVLVGIDVIGGLLTEINVTSPTGIREVKTFGGADIAALFWGAVEARAVA
ncbi:MAG: glutathione synthase [Pseudomonadota bacterium]